MGTIKTFRLFVSSTFSDMVAERNALQAYVYPKIQEFCASRGVRFQAIDLRWGVSKEAGLSHRATDVCLKEIERCQKVTKRPNFLLLMGDRYGWQPLPDDIPSAEWDILIPRMSDAEQNALEAWYWRDDNAVPPVYVLQPRTEEYVNQDKWNAVESHLRGILLNALSGLDWPHERRMKYEASVTEQEIEAGIFRYRHAREGVFCFFRTIDDLPPDNGTYRDTRPDALSKLADLKQRLEAHIRDNIQPHHARWTGSGVVFDEEAFCKAVEETLKQAIKAELATFDDMSPLEIEEEQHRVFMIERVRHFVGRTASLHAIGRYLLSDQSLPLVVHGQSGVGKSTVMARAIEQAIDPIYRFIGISPEASDIRLLLVSLCHSIQTRYKLNEPVPQDYEELIKAFPKFLASATAEQPLIIFLDALDQLAVTDSLSNLRWLPNVLPLHVKLVLSTIPGTYLDALKRRLPSNPLEIVPMERSDGKFLLEKLLHAAGRTLQPDQHAEVLSKFAENGLPLYLKLAFEEAKLWHFYPKNVTRDVVLHPDVPSLIEGNLFKRLSDNAEHGEMLVSRSLAYIQASRNGLSETEIIEVLTQDGQFWSDFETRSHESQHEALKIVKLLPIAVWSRLYFDLEPYLVERSADGVVLLAFYHRQFSEVVEAKYLNGRAKTRLHRRLAQYFRRKADPACDSTWDGHYPRALNELPHHLLQGQNWAGLEETLCDLGFIEAKCKERMLLGLLDDYQFVSAVLEKRLASYAKRIEPYRWFVRGKSHVLGVHPELTFQQAANYSEDAAIQQSAIERWKSGRERRPWLKLVRREVGGIAAYVSFLTKDLPIGATISHLGHRLALCDDGTVSVYDVQSQRRILHLPCNANTTYTAIAMSSDGSILACAEYSESAPKIVTLWDVDKQTQVGQFDGHLGRILALKFSPQVNVLAMGGALSEDGEIALWNVTDRSLVWRQTIIGAIARRVAFSPDGSTLVIAQGDGVCSFWSIASGERENFIEAHHGTVNGLYVSPSGDRIATAGKDGLCQVWSFPSKPRTRLQNFVELLLNKKKSQTLVAHRAALTAIAFLNESHLVSGDKDGYAYIWDTSNHRQLHTLFSGEGRIVELAVSDDGGFLLALSEEDRTCRLYKTEKLDQSALSASFYERIKFLQFQRNSNNVVAWRNGEKVKLLSFETDAPNQDEPRTEIAQVDEAISLAVSRNGRYILTVNRSSKWILWDTRHSQSVSGAFTITIDNGVLTSVADNGRWIGILFQEYVERISTDEMRSYTHRLPMVPGAIGQQDDGTIRVVGINTRLQHRLAEEILVVDLHLDGRIFYWGAFDGDSPRNSRGFHFSDLDSFVRCTQSPDEKGIVDIWHFQGERKTREEFSGAVNIHDFTSDGKWLLLSEPSTSMAYILETTSPDMSTRWLFPLSEAVACATVQPDGDLIALGYKQGGIDILQRILPNGIET